jgi:endonuclease/exonuclease/phosphatase family metal-dependent hydrolase
LRGGEYGVAILSKFPIQSSQSFALPQVSKAEMRVLGEVTLWVGGRELVFANTHLDAERSDDNRNAQMEFISNRYRDSKQTVIICGDLNSKPNSQAVALLDQVFKRTCIADCLPTFPQKNPRTTIDYIATKNFKGKLMRFDVIDEQYASDHRPIFAQFQLVK